MPACTRRLPALAPTVVAITAALSLVGCGGGGGSTGTSTASAAAAPVALDDTATRRLALAEKAYLGTPRVPDGFRLDPPLVGITGPVATTHLKNTDLAGTPSGAPRWELCTDDPAQALAWSEQRATWQGAYADLVETNASASAFELVRVPRNDSTARLRHRVFRCDWLDRSGSDLDSGTGSAGTLKTLPVTSTALRDLVEYLWQFTDFNNADHVVTASVPSTAGAGQLGWRLEMTRLVRASAAGDCDRIERLQWTHTADVAGGALTRQLAIVESFRARRDAGAVQLCSP